MDDKKTSAITINIECDSSRFPTVLGLLEDIIDSADEVGDGAISLNFFIDDLFALYGGCDLAASKNQITVLPKPSDCFIMLAAAVRARNLHRDAAEGDELSSHDESPADVGRADSMETGGSGVKPVPLSDTS